MNRRTYGLTSLAILFAATTLLAQPQGPGRDVPVVKQVGPEEVRRLGDRLRQLQGTGGLPKDLLDQFQKLKQQSPNATDEDLVRKMLEKNPSLNDPEQIARWKDYLDKTGQMPGIPPANPGQGPPPSRPPTVPPLPKVDSPPGTRPPPIDPKNPPPGFDPRNPQQPWPRNLDLPPPDRDSRLPNHPRNAPAPKLDPEQALKRDRQFKAFAGAWEENFGPLNDTPAVKQLLFEVITGQDGSGQDKGGLGDLFGDGTGDGKALDKMLDSNVDTSGFKLSDLGLSKWDFGSSDSSSSSSRPPSYSSSGSSSSGFGSFGEGSWLPVVLFVGVLGGALLLWWLWPKLTGTGERLRPLAGLGPWPVDPRTIADRAALVKAFEYLSLLLCGDDAMTWNHVTIAAAFRERMPQAEAIAEPLAWFYALARYTPASEPLPPGTIAKAREYLCDLAGVSPA